jgi:hypothetical protein
VCCKYGFVVCDSRGCEGENVSTNTPPTSSKVRRYIQDVGSELFDVIVNAALWLTDYERMKGIESTVDGIYLTIEVNGNE